MTEPPSRFDRVRGLREALPATGAGIYLATHQAGPLPAETQAAVHESDEMELRVGRVGPDRADDIEQRQREAQAVVGAVVSADPDRIVLTHGTPDAARLVATELLDASVRPQEKVLIVRGVDKAVAGTVRDIAEVASATVEDVDEVPRILSEDVVLVVMSHVDADGRSADVRAAAQAVGKGKGWLLVDVSRSVGTFPFDVAELGADFVIGGLHRWLLGPEATAFLWVTPRHQLEAPEWMRQATAPFARGQLLGIARSVGWLLMYVELPWALDRTVALADQLYEGLAAIDGVELLADPGAHGAVASIRVEGWDPESVAEELGRSIFAIVEVDAEANLIRASVGAWNRENEIDRFVERVAELAANTPETLPRRPSLTVISGPIEPEENDDT